MLGENFHTPKKLLSKAIPKLEFADKMDIAKMLIFFSIPVVITGLAELALYDMATLVIGVYYPSKLCRIF